MHTGLFYNSPDITSPATSGRHLLEFEKTPENAASEDFGSNLSVAAFCLANPIGGLLHKATHCGDEISIGTIFEPLGPP